MVILTWSSLQCSKVLICHSSATAVLILQERAPRRLPSLRWCHAVLPCQGGSWGWAVAQGSVHWKHEAGESQQMDSLVYLTVVWGCTFSMTAMQASECRLRGNFAVYVRKSVFRPMLSIAFLNSFFQWLFWILSELDDGKSDLGQNICFLPVVLSVLAVSWAASTSIKEAEGAHDGSRPALEAAVRLAQLCHKTH